jgi:hypothetical protein
MNLLKSPRAARIADITAVLIILFALALRALPAPSAPSRVATLSNPVHVSAAEAARQNRVDAFCAKSAGLNL